MHLRRTLANGVESMATASTTVEDRQNQTPQQEPNQDHRTDGDVAAGGSSEKERRRRRGKNLAPSRDRTGRQPEKTDLKGRQSRLKPPPASSNERARPPDSPGRGLRKRTEVPAVVDDDDDFAAALQRTEKKSRSVPGAGRSGRPSQIRTRKSQDPPATDPKRSTSLPETEAAHRTEAASGEGPGPVEAKATRVKSKARQKVKAGNVIKGEKAPKIKGPIVEEGLPSELEEFKGRFGSDLEGKGSRAKNGKKSKGKGRRKSSSPSPPIQGRPSKRGAERANRPLAAEPDAGPVNVDPGWLSSDGEDEELKRLQTCWSDDDDVFPENGPGCRSPVKRRSHNGPSGNGTDLTAEKRIPKDRRRDGVSPIEATLPPEGHPEPAGRVMMRLQGSKRQRAPIEMDNLAGQSPRRAIKSKSVSALPSREPAAPKSAAASSGVVDPQGVDAEEAYDVFVTDSLPAFARSYILPRVMRKLSSRDAGKEDQSPEGRRRHMSESTYATGGGRLGGQDYDKVEYSSTTSAAIDAFKYSMLRASLEYSGAIPFSDSCMLGLGRRNTRSSYGNAVLGDESEQLQQEAVSGRSSRVSCKTNTSVWSEGKRVLPHRSGWRQKLLNPGSGSASAAAAASGGPSLAPSSRSNKKSSLVPCTGPGPLKQYGAYLKSGGYVPLTVLDPEMGIEACIFAQDSAAVPEQPVFYGGGDKAGGFEVDEGGSNVSAEAGVESLSQGHRAIENIFDKIVEKYGLPKSDGQHHDRLQGRGTTDNTKAKNPKLVSGDGDLQRPSKPPQLSALDGRKKAASKKRKKAANLLFDDDDDDGGGDDDDGDGDQGSKNKDDSSGYSSARTFSSSGGGGGGGLLSSFLPPLGGPNSSEELFYQKQYRENRLLDDAMTGNNLLSMMIDDGKDRYSDVIKRSGGLVGGGNMTSTSGVDAVDLFIDPLSVFGSDRHPALQEVLKQIDSTKKNRAEKLRLHEQLMRMRTTRRDEEVRRERLLAQAKDLQLRATRFKEKLAVVWEERLKDELDKTGPLEEVCAALREDLDAQHKKRIDMFETKMKPIIIKDGPSRKANYKIAAARLHYEIYSLTQRLRLTTIRVEYEESKRTRREKQVRKLRDEISEKKTLITTVTKGIPFTKIDVRPQEQLPNYTGPTANDINPLLSDTANEALAAAGLAGAAAAAAAAGGTATRALPFGLSAGALPNIGVGPAGGGHFLQQYSSSSSASVGGRPSVYASGPPPGISSEAAAAAAASMAKDDDDDDDDDDEDDDGRGLGRGGGGHAVSKSISSNNRTIHIS